LGGCKKKKGKHSGRENPAFVKKGEKKKHRRDGISSNQPAGEDSLDVDWISAKKPPQKKTRAGPLCWKKKINGGTSKSGLSHSV